MGHPVGHWVGHPPACRTAPAVKKGGSLPSLPAPLARFGSAGLGRTTRTTTANNGRGGWDTPPGCFWDTPPSVRVPCSLPRSPPRSLPRNGVRCGGTIRSPPRGGQADGGPESEAVNRPSRRRRGGRALGELLQHLKTIGRRVEPAGRAQEFTIAGGNRVLKPGDFLADVRVGLGRPDRVRRALPSPSWVQCFRTGAARSAASAPVPTATTCTANVRARSAAQRGAWATPHARSSLSVDWPAST